MVKIYVYVKLLENEKTNIYDFLTMYECELEKFNEFIENLIRDYVLYHYDFDNSYLTSDSEAYLFFYQY